MTELPDDRLNSAFEERVRSELHRVGARQRATTRTALLQDTRRHHRVRRRVTVGFAVSAVAVAVILVEAPHDRRRPQISSSGVPDVLPTGPVSVPSTSTSLTSASPSTFIPTTVGPTPSTALPAGIGATEYVVAEGDTLKSIADSHGTTREAISELNHWRSGIDEALVEGQTILVPDS
jgi:LysM repeat protein